MEITKSNIVHSITTGNLFLTQYFHMKNPMPINGLSITSFSGNEELFHYIVTNLYIRCDSLMFLNAAEKNYEEIVYFMIKEKTIKINTKDKNKWTALMLASLKGYANIVKFLLEQKGIKINAKNKNGTTALMLASGQGKVGIVKILLEQEGIDVNTKDNIIPK